MGKRYISKNLRRREKKKRAGAAAAVPAVSFVLFLFLIGAVIGRYQRQLRSDSSVRAQNFYFTSNLLDGGTHTLVPGSTEVEFTLGNHADELRCSEMDISYEVTVSREDTSEGGAADPTGSEVKVTPGTGTLPGDSAEDAKVTISNLQAGRYVVTAVGTGGYSKTLRATIVVPPVAGQLYYYTDASSGEYILLTVWNEGDESGMATVEYTGIPDNTNPNMTKWKAGGETVSKEVEITPHESRVFRFFGGTVNVTGAARKIPY